MLENPKSAGQYYKKPTMARLDIKYIAIDIYRSIELPKGSIEKLIGRTLTWTDEPYEMQEQRI